MTYDDTEKRYNWTLEKVNIGKPTGERVGYSSSFGPVSAGHVRNSPSVKEWAGDSDFVVLAETYEDWDTLKG